MTVYTLILAHEVDCFPEYFQILQRIFIRISLETKTPLVDIVFVLDISGSLEETYKEHIRWCIELIKALPISKDKDFVRVAAIKYADQPETVFSLGTFSQKFEMINALKGINFKAGVTKTANALRKADRELFEPGLGGRSGATRIVVTFTDGLSSDLPDYTADSLRSKNVKTYAVSVSSSGFVPELLRIAGTDENVFGPKDLYRLKRRLLEDVEASKEFNRISEEFNEPFSEVNLVNATKKTFKATLYTNKPFTTTQKAKINSLKTKGKTAFGQKIIRRRIIKRRIIHTSDLNALVSSLLFSIKPDISPTRVALIQFAGVHVKNTEWSFDAHKNNSELMTAINNIRYIAGTTYIGAALEAAANMLRNRTKFVRTMVILLTDGFSQDDAMLPAFKLMEIPYVEVYVVSLAKLNNIPLLIDMVGGDHEKVFIGEEKTKQFEFFFKRQIECK
ncbi:hypothetical protein WR25_23314 [Diploscapter pachys]|uniref:VWFA domain-containing protein n=1 Tax=Diploscapter pachys TaxID=2018661 RepID=A0A2A2J7W0_9BILA|nr:hypothetical protein WR25_23314 [Diploscapter pachys]